MRAIEVLGSTSEGSERPLFVTMGMAMLAPGRVATEADTFPADLLLPRKSEAVARALAERGVHATTLRLPPSVHGLGDHGFIPILIGLARRTDLVRLARSGSLPSFVSNLVGAYPVDAPA